MHRVSQRVFPALFSRPPFSRGPIERTSGLPAHGRHELDPELIAEAARVLASGGLVAFPTDTLYGLGADAFNAQAVGRVFRAKGRPANSPVPILLDDPADLRAVADPIPEAARCLAAAFWPGPLTLVVRAGTAVPGIVTAESGTVGVRVPDHDTPRALAGALGRPITGTSANTSQSQPHTDREAVLADLGDSVGIVLPGVCGSYRAPSTVVDCTGPVCVVVRAGAVSLDVLREVLPGIAGERSPATSAAQSEVQ